MRAYPEVYLDEVVETQGKLFDYVSQTFPNKNTEDFISVYMKSKTRGFVDSCQAYVNTMDYKTLLDYFLEIDKYELKDGDCLGGFFPWWVGEFYAYYQWYYNKPSSYVIDKIPLSFLKTAYPALHDIELKLAVEKVGEL